MIIIDCIAKKNLVLPFLVNKKKFFIWKKGDTYNLRVIDKNLLLSKNGKLDKKTELLLVATQ